LGIAKQKRSLGNGFGDEECDRFVIRFWEHRSDRLKIGLVMKNATASSCRVGITCKTSKTDPRKKGSV
jgi:hypothetical protein